MEVKATDAAVQVVVGQDGSAIGTARRAAVALAERQGWPETVTGRIALVATELATNLVRHAGGGTLIVQRAVPDGGLEILALDRGPGIASLPEALRDGYSTAGSSGSGLGAIGRAADQWDVFSAPGAGTVVLARFREDSRRSPPAQLVVGGVSLPHPGESVCGDAWAAARTPTGLSVMVVDGLGHGTPAAAAAAAAVQVFQERVGASVVEIVEDTHAALRATRGAAVGVATIQPEAGRLGFVGVGNIAGTLVRAGESRSLVSHPGIVGHQCHKIQEFTYPWGPGSLLILHSDGLQSRWQLGRHPGLAERDPTIVSAALYRDHVRGRDDVTVVTAREAA
jgi:anti-sigma regulatory factor (Ser/Thr protein kinase)